MTSFGIDLGTTNSVISHLQGGRPIPIEIDGSPVIPSVVLFGEGGVVVGREARNLELVHPGRTIRSAKRRMGTDHRYDVAGRAVSPEEVSAEVLRALKAGAEAATGEVVRDVVITVPARFDDLQRRATLRAGELAGLNVLRLVNEPTAASLVYDHVGVGSESGDASVVLIYDLGGGTFDVSVIEVFEGVREVRSTAGNTQLGGDDFDEAIERVFLDHLRREHGLDTREDPRAMARLRRLAEETKIALSTDTQVHVREEFLTSAQGVPVHLDLLITRRQFEELIHAWLESTMVLARQAVDDAKLGDQPLQRICLVGGSTRIPLVRTLLESAFEVEIHEEVDPDLAVGLGASLQAGLVAGVPLDRMLVDVASHTLGVVALGEFFDDEGAPDSFVPVLRRNTVLPAVRTEEFYTVSDDQEAVEVRVYQGEAARASENRFVGGFDFPLRPAPGRSPVRVEFSYDLSGVIRVSVNQVGTDNAKTVALSLAKAHVSVGDSGSAAEPTGPVERKARRLLEDLEGRDKQRLQMLLDTYTAASVDGREAAEEAILDFILDMESAIPF